MANKTTGWEVKISKLRVKFPKMTTAALAMPVLLLLFQIPNLDTESSLEPVGRPAAPSQPEAAVEVSPGLSASPQESLVLENESEVSTDSLSETEPSVESVDNPAPESYLEPAPASGRAGFIAGTCKRLKAQGLGPFYEGDINYTPQRDRDNDGIACE